MAPRGLIAGTSIVCTQCGYMMISHLPINFLENKLYVRCVKLGCPSYGKLFGALLPTVELTEEAD